MVVVLIVVALVVAGAVGSMMLSDDERDLTRASGEVEALAKRARTLAALQQRPYALEFFENRVSLMPLAEALVLPEEREKAAQRLAADGGAVNSIRASWSGEGEMTMFVRRWASDSWVPVDSKNRQVWRFEPQGFCEPVGVRLAMEKSWIEVEFNPLTANVRDTAMEAY